MPRNLLLQFEFLCLPSNCFGYSLPDFKECFTSAIKAEGYEFSRIKFWVSQYRVAILIEGIPECGSDCLKEIRGPKASAAYDYNNQATPSAKGFASAQGVELKDLVTKVVDGERYLFAVKSVAGRQLEKGLAKLKDSIALSIPFVSRAWKANSCFPQPLLNFTAMLDDKLLDMEIEGVLSRAELFSRRNSDFESIKINSVFHYADIMNELGNLPDLSERGRAIEAAMQLILPEGYRIRADAAELTRCFLFSEGLTPFLLRYDFVSLGMSEYMVGYYINNYTSYLPCEDPLGRLLPAVVGFSSYENIADLEKDNRAMALGEGLLRISRVWHNDTLVLHRAIEFCHNTEHMQNESDYLLTKSVKWVSERLNYKHETNVLTLLAFLGDSLQDTEIWKNTPSMALSLLWEGLETETHKQMISDISNVTLIIAFLREMQSFFLAKIPSPKSFEVSIFCFCFLCKLYVQDVKNREIYMKKLCALLVASKIKLDLFEFLETIYGLNKSLRRLWLSSVAQGILKETKADLITDYYMNLTCLDPASLFEAIADFKALDATKLDYLVALFNRIQGKIERIKETLLDEPIEQLEKELDNVLKIIEIQRGINYNAILGFFLKEKINIEASLLNLPSVLNEDDREYYSRISILQRLHRQLSKLPFMRKE